MSGRVVLLHGLAGSAQAWQQLVDVLPTHLTVTAPQLPWQAGADSTWAHRPGTAAAVLADSYAEGDVVVAHSYAATLLLAHLAGEPARRPAGVVLVSPFYRPRAADFDWSTITHYLVDFDRILAEGVRAASRRPLADDLVADMAIAVRDRVGPYAWTRFFESYLATPTLALDRIGGRVHVVHGRRDGAAPFADALALHEALPDAVLTESPASGHFPMLDDVQLLARVIARVIADANEPLSVPIEPTPQGAVA